MAGLLAVAALASPAPRPAHPLCPTADTACILHQLTARGLIRAPQQQRGRARAVGDPGLGEAGRSSRNSKYRPDCWAEEEAPEAGSGARQRRAAYRGAGRGWGRGRGAGAPCLWETSYYMGDSETVNREY